MVYIVVYFFVLSLTLVTIEGFVPLTTIPQCRKLTRTFDSTTSTISTTSTEVLVYENSDRLATALCDHIVALATREIELKGSFHFAVPGGSVLKLLKSLKDQKYDILDWSKCHMFYVNHKCLPDSDPSATHKKAKSLFLDYRTSLNAYALTPGEDVKDGEMEAIEYFLKLSTTVPQEKSFSIFDFVLLGMGKDGHIGSLYPNRQEVLEKSKSVVSVDKKSPASISLTLPVINSAKSVRVVLMGEDKAEAAVTGVLKQKSAYEYPVCGVDNPRTAWMLDAPCASLLRPQYACTEI